MYFLYQIILSIILLISPFIIFLRILKNKESKIRFTEKFGFSSKKKIDGLLIWFHGASVGEILSIIPLIKHYEKDNSINQILITSSTVSSSKVLQKFKFKKTVHQFYPIDHFIFVNFFLKFWKPSIAIFIESEIWPCMFKKIYKKQIPLLLLNARISNKTFDKWLKFKNFSKSILSNIKVAYPQNFETRLYLKKLEFKNLKEIGNLKFSEYQENIEQINRKFKFELKNKKFWIASSTHDTEEIFCAKAHLILKNKFKNLITIIIPRHVDRVEKITTDIQKLNLKVTLHSSQKKKLKDTDIYIVDTFGETKKFHKIGSTVFLGGSIIKRGGQNPLEAARFGAKILHGPHTNNFKDVYKLLKSYNFSKKINTPEQLASAIVFKKNIKSGIKIKNIGEKILKKTIKELDKHIFDEFKKT